MTFDAIGYWTRSDVLAGFRPNPAHAEQERALRAVLDSLAFANVLEIGCGIGRITSVLEAYGKPITVIDIGSPQLDATLRRVPAAEGIRSSLQALATDRRWELVIASEVLMHVPPADIGAACAKLRRLASRWIVTVDWTEPIDAAIHPHNWLHDYGSLFGSIERSIPVGLQTIHVISVEGGA